MQFVNATFCFSENLSLVMWVNMSVSLSCLYNVAVSLTSMWNFKFEYTVLSYTVIGPGSSYCGKWGKCACSEDGSVCSAGVFLQTLTFKFDDPHWNM